MIDCCCETDYLLTLVDNNTHSVLISNENYHKFQTNQILHDKICDNVLGSNIGTCSYTVEPVYNGHSQKDQKWFSRRIMLNAGQKYFGAFCNTFDLH